jgi:hypothetical protein
MSFAAVSAIAAAEQVAFPDVKEGKVVEDNWYGIFAEGGKIGYGQDRISEITFNGKACLLMETFETVQTSAQGAKREDVDRLIVEKDTYSPLFYSGTSTSPYYKHTLIAKAERQPSLWALTVTRTFNDKTSTDSLNLPGDDMIYFRGATGSLYRAKYLKDKKDATVNVFDLSEMKMDTEKFKYKGEKKMGEGAKAISCQVVENEDIETWYGPEGKPIKGIVGEGFLVYVNTDEKSAKDMAATLEGYKAPDCLAGDVLTAKEQGIKLTRPAKSYFFLPSFKDNYVSLLDLTTGIKISAFAVPGGAKGATLPEALKHFRDSSHYHLTDGKEIDVGKNRCLYGLCKGGEDVDADTGEYFIFIREDRVVLVIAHAPGDVYKKAEKDIEKCVESLEFVKPEYDESKLAFTDKTTSLQLKLPNPGWKVMEREEGEGALFTLYQIWTRSFISGRQLPALDADVTPQQALQTLAKRNNATGSGVMKVGKYDAIWLEYSHQSKDGDKLMVRQFIVFRENDAVGLLIVAQADAWNKIKADLDSILQSLKFPEEKEK